MKMSRPLGNEAKNGANLLDFFDVRGQRNIT
jgi:hypothetical protein